MKTLNVMAEAMRVAFADRATWMADADFVTVPARGLINSGYIALRDDLITPGVRRTPDPLAGDPRPFETPGLAAATAIALPAPVSTENGTTHFSVVDKWGNVVSYTNTIESSHGIGTFAGYTREDGSFRNHGFLLNNELTDFNTSITTNAITGEIGYNDVQPHKRHAVVGAVRLALGRPLRSPATRHEVVPSWPAGLERHSPCAPSTRRCTSSTRGAGRRSAWRCAAGAPCSN